MLLEWRISKLRVAEALDVDEAQSFNMLVCKYVHIRTCILTCICVHVLVRVCVHLFVQRFCRFRGVVGHRGSLKVRFLAFFV